MDVTEPTQSPSPAMPKLHVCPDCGKSFDKPQGLGAHRSKAHGYQGKRKQAKPANEPEPVFKGKWAKSGNGPVERRFEVEATMAAAINETLSLGYQDAVNQFLPHLARKLERCRLDDKPVDHLHTAFLTLYLDTH